MKNRTIPGFLVGLAIALLSVLAYSSTTQQANSSLKPLSAILMLLFDEEEKVEIENILSDAILEQSGISTVDEETTFTLINHKNKEKLLKFSCEIVLKPQNSIIAKSIQIDPNIGEIKFVPDVEGVYIIKCTGTSNDSKEFTVNVKSTLPVDLSKVVFKDPSIPASKNQGVVINQIWVKSRTLSEIDLNSLLANYDALSPIYYDSKYSKYLVEFDETSVIAKEQITELALESKIDKIYSRLYTGKYHSADLDSILPNDVGNLTDGGDNWHLEMTNMKSAWEYVFNKQSYVDIGISDGAFNVSHEDLDFTRNVTARDPNLTNSEWKNQQNHGNRTVGSIAAVTDNAKGIAGINWKANIYGSNSNDISIQEIMDIAPNVKVLNMSWGVLGHIPKNFNPYDPEFTLSRFMEGQFRNGNVRSISEIYRDFAEDNESKLFVFSAGNGVGDGSPDNSDVTGYGVDSRYGNGNLHYRLGFLSRVDNILVVGSVLENGIMPKTSNYGRSVDIVAPTKYVSTDFDGYSKYTGTSASAPVVSGVASLIYSINPKFTGKDVKKILIESSDADVTQRYTEFGLLGESKPVDLTSLIPILNAGKAVKLAKEITEGKIITTNIEIPKPSVNNLQVSINKPEEFLVKNIQLQVEGFNGAAWELQNRVSAKTDTTNLSFSPEFKKYRITGSGKLVHKSTGVEVNTQILVAGKEEFTIASVNFNTKNSNTGENISNTILEIEPFFISNRWATTEKTYTVTTDGNGTALVYLLGNDYKIHASKATHNNSSTLIYISQEQVNTSIGKDILLSEIGAPLVGSLSGMITNQIGDPVTNASVSIIGGGVTTSGITDVNGYYQIANIPKEVNSKYVSSFTLKVTASGYVNSTTDDVIVLKSSDGESTQNIVLIKIFAVRDDNLEIVADYNHQLLWLDTTNRNTNISFYTAESRCFNLNIGGFSGWRLPNINELEYLVDKNNHPTTGLPFENLLASNYYSTTRHSTSRRCPTIDGHSNWGINFSTGNRISSSIYYWTAFCSVGFAPRSANYLCVHEQ